MNRLTAIAATVLVAGAALFTIAPASSEVPSNGERDISPVRLSHCSSVGTRWNYVDLSFVNQKRVAVDELRVAMRFSGTERAITDKGNFAPGVPIHHEYPSAGIPAHRPDNCAVEYVHFVDGSTWPT